MWNKPNIAPQAKEIKDITKRRGAQNFNISLISIPAKPQAKNVVAACGVTNTP